MSDQFTRQVSDGRQAGKPLEDEVKGLVARCAREGTPLTGMKLRETEEARTALIGLARAEFARLAGATLMQPVSEAEADTIKGRLKTLVVEAIDGLPEDKRTVRGRVYKGEDIAGAIPDQAAFLREVDLMKEGKFFELNTAGQLVMMDGCKEAYGLNENVLQARIRQTRIVYRDAEGRTQVMAGAQYFEVTEYGRSRQPIEMEVSEQGRGIGGQFIIMERGLPTLSSGGLVLGRAGSHTGEYARMNGKGQFERRTQTWVEDSQIGDRSPARFAQFNLGYVGFIYSAKTYYISDQSASLGSRGVLRVNLNLGF